MARSSIEASKTSDITTDKDTLQFDDDTLRGNQQHTFHCSMLSIISWRRQKGKRTRSVYKPLTISDTVIFLVMWSYVARGYSGTF